MQKKQNASINRGPCEHQRTDMSSISPGMHPFSSMASRTLIVIALSGLFEPIGLIANDAAALNLLSATCVTDLTKQNCHDYPAISLAPHP